MESCYQIEIESDCHCHRLSCNPKREECEIPIHVKIE